MLDSIFVRPSPFWVAGLAIGGFVPLSIAGGLVCGAGWALAQVGEGELWALATVLGIVAGTWVQRALASPAAAPCAPAPGA